MIPSSSNHSQKQTSSLNWPKKIETDLTTVLNFHIFRAVSLDLLSDIHQIWTRPSPPERTIQKTEQASKTNLKKPPLAEKSSQKTKVHFHSSRKIVLVPTCREYFEEGLTNDLWVSEAEYEKFKSEAVSELKVFMRTFHITGKDALTLLYQPGYSHICEDPGKYSTLKSKSSS